MPPLRMPVHLSESPLPDAVCRNTRSGFPVLLRGTFVQSQKAVTADIPHGGLSMKGSPPCGMQIQAPHDRGAWKRIGLPSCPAGCSADDFDIFDAQLWRRLTAIMVLD